MADLPYKVEGRFIRRPVHDLLNYHTGWLYYASYKTEEERKAGLESLRSENKNMEFRKMREGQSGAQ